MFKWIAIVGFVVGIVVVVYFVFFHVEESPNIYIGEPMDMNGETLFSFGIENNTQHSITRVHVKFTCIKDELTTQKLVIFPCENEDMTKCKPIEKAEMRWTKVVIDGKFGSENCKAEVQRWFPRELMFQ